MPIITARTRFIPRLLALAGLSGVALVGFAGAQFTFGTWNQVKAGELSQERDVAAIRAESIRAIENAEAEQAWKMAEASAASELGMAQATCGDTLSQFYFEPGRDVYQQLTLWGFDFFAPQYNSGRWYPLFDSNKVLFAAVRRDPATGQQVIVQADLQSLDQASICNKNELN
jgi:hypothetical protein